MRALPLKCGCARRSSRLRVYTCPICVSAAIRGELEGNALAQLDLFEGRESVSVSALSWPTDVELDDELENTAAVEDGLPF